MNIEKIFETIIRPQVPSYFSLRYYRYDEDIQSSDVLRAFMNSRYFLWKEDDRHKVLVNVNGKNTSVDWDFHGLYDVKQLSLLDFDKVSFQLFKDAILSFIDKKIGQDDKVVEIQHLLENEDNTACKYYIMCDISEDKIHPWTVYEFFISGIIVNPTEKSIRLVEFGRD